ncbi:putative membrane protein [Pseudomonas sp. CCOS 191]|nr:putative membrane protein [Pseudomonas sp. CCOS 191]
MSAALSVYACCVVVLFFKMLAISCYQGYFRLRYLAFTNSEDAAVFRRSVCPTELPQVTRAAQAWRNDLENIPLFLSLSGLAVALETPSIPSAWLMGLFTVARILHTATYLASIQPWRTVSYALGVICLIGLAALVIEAVANFSSDGRVCEPPPELDSSSTTDLDKPLGVAASANFLIFMRIVGCAPAVGNARRGQGLHSLVMNARLRCIGGASDGQQVMGVSLVLLQVQQGRGEVI